MSSSLMAHPGRRQRSEGDRHLIRSAVGGKTDLEERALNDFLYEANAVPSFRRVIADGSIGLIEDASVGANDQPPAGYTARHQIVFPYWGLFQYQVGALAPLVDANQTLFVLGDRDFVDRHPVRNLGHASLIVTPADDILAEVCNGQPVRRNSSFGQMVRPASPRLRLLTHRLRRLRDSAAASIESDELMLLAITEALRQPNRDRQRASQMVDRARQFLHAWGTDPVTLETVARAVGASPVYLTQAFTRSEGVPLYRYQMNIRLGRALAVLPDIDDITSLALELGFSSHSHFSATFKGAFGISPSQFRSAIRSMGRGRDPSLIQQKPSRHVTNRDWQWAAPLDAHNRSHQSLPS